jgi:dihydroflavonol-4-reductase
MLEYISDHVTRRPPNGTAEGVRIALAASDLSIGKARNELGYSPRPIEPVLRETITHLLARNGLQPSGAIEHHALSSRAS